MPDESYKNCPNYRFDSESIQKRVYIMENRVEKIEKTIIKWGAIITTVLVLTKLVPNSVINMLFK